MGRIIVARHPRTIGTEKEGKTRHLGSDEVCRSMRSGVHPDEFHSTIPNLVAEFERNRVCTVISTGLTRTDVPAKIAAHELGVRHLVLTGLREREMSGWDGLTWAEVREKFPDFEAVRNQPLTADTAAIERSDFFLKRIARTLNGILGTGGKNVGIVGHSLSNLAIEVMIEHLLAEQRSRIDMTSCMAYIRSQTDLQSPDRRLGYGQAMSFETHPEDRPPAFKERKYTPLPSSDNIILPLQSGSDRTYHPKNRRQP